MLYSKLYSRFFVTVLLIVFGVFLSLDNTKKADILIVSPHPDDATLCCAGLIQQTLKLGKRIHIIILTDGEGYVEAAANLSGKSASALSPRDMLRLGRVRIREEIRAQHFLGLGRQNLTFFGYPDGWLDEVYKTEDGQVFTSPFTKVSTSRIGRKPYANQSIVTDIANIIRQTHPNAIYVSGPFDTALDHQIAYHITRDAIAVTGYTGSFYTYANHASASASMQPAITVWLTEIQMNNKAEAIESYATQLNLESEYLRAFAQKEENFY